MVRILVAEDDEDIRRLVCTCLTDSGYESVGCRDGREALRMFETQPFDLLISDIMMPGMDGVELAENVRLFEKNIPILFLTALDSKPAQFKSFKAGADDYVVKPFDPDILMLRVAALLRRAGIEKSHEITAGNLYMNSEEHAAYINGDPIAFTVREFDLLFKFLSYPKKTFSRSQLMNEFWDYNSSATSRTVDVYIAKIREKTAACDGFEIQTVHGLGYKAVLK